MKRILFTSVGRRVELIQAFDRASQRTGIAVWLIGADVSSSAPALAFCDEAVYVCRIRDAAYIPMLLEICREKQVDLVIPTIDTDLLLLAQNRTRFEEIGTRVLISKEEQIRLCRDKRYTAAFFHRCGLKSPDPVDAVSSYKGGFPCFIKPLDGSSSVDAYRVERREDLEGYARKIGKYIIQPFIEGREYTIDIFCDFDGNPIYITPRERLAVRSGEVLKTCIVQDEGMIRQARAIIGQFHPVGPITVQLIRENLSGDDNFIEINPRFGGGAPLSMMAGADAAAATLRLLAGETLSYQEGAAKSGLNFSRFDQCICLEERAMGLRQVDTWEEIAELVQNGVLTGNISAVLFDLDDTLYPEKEYVRSGFAAVAAGLPQVKNAEEKLWSAFEKGLPAIDAVLREEGIGDESVRQKCLELYRSHEPKLHLYPQARQLLDWLQEHAVRAGIITDGRPEGQRAKLEALGLSGLECVITDSLGGAQFRKPCDIAFRIMQGRMEIPYAQMVYIGDNPAKDFKACKQLGLQGIWFRNKGGLYA